MGNLLLPVEIGRDEFTINEFMDQVLIRSCAKSNASLVHFTKIRPNQLIKQSSIYKKLSNAI